jgi:short subunit dehydrogenase-like uncharacterized protein
METLSNRPVAVFGATGHTGHFVVTELQRRGIAPIAVARDCAKLAALGYAERGIETRDASIDDPGSLDRALAGVAAVVNCAGPFLDTAEAVATAAVRAGVHYLDITAEQASARSTLENFDEAAHHAGIIVMPAMGFFGGFADLLVTAAMGDWRFADAIGIGIALDRWHPTAGTRNTGKRNTARRMVIIDGRLAPAPQPATEIAWNFPKPFGRQTVLEVPLSEIVLIAQHMQTSVLHTYIGQRALQDIQDPATPAPIAIDEAGRSAQTFAVDAVVRKGAQTRRITAQGRDIYAFSAPLVCEAVQRILDGKVLSRGAQAPGAIFDSRDFLDALAPGHLTFEVTAGPP